MNQFLSIKQKLKLNHMLKVIDRNELSELNWLKLSVSNYSPESFLKVTERLEYIRSFQLDFDLSFIHPTRLKQLARLGSKYDPRSLQRFSDDKRYTLLVAYLSASSEELIDQAFDIHNRQMNTLEAKGRKRRLEFQRTNGKALNEKIVHYSILGDTLIEAKQKEIDVFTLLEKLIPWDNFVESLEEAKQLSRPLDNDYLDLLASRFSYLRKYTPTLLNSLVFKSTAATEPLIEALSVIRNINDSGKRKIPEHAPLNFTTKRWAKYISNKDGTINRQYYELAAFTELRNRIKGGDVSIIGSKKYEEFDFYLISKEEWASILESDTKLAVPFDLSERISSLNVRLEWLNDNIDTLDDVTIEEGHLHVSKLEKEVPEGAKQFSSKLYSMLPRIKLTDLLLEVANWTDFDKHFLHASTGKEPKIEDRDYILGTLMAMGTNIGLTKMAAATPGISYYEMANIAQWRMYDDAMDNGQSTNSVGKFSACTKSFFYLGRWHSSSSDGMRVQIGVPSLIADHNPHYGSGKGATFYRHTSDQYSSFYTKVINTNARDAVHVIDGLLHHETDLTITEHYTDQVFGLPHILEFRFAPRLRGLSKMKLYTIEEATNFPTIQSILKGKINQKLIQENYEDILRLSHSIQNGKVSSSLILEKLGSYARKNQLSSALKEAGSIEKTIFILDYISKEDFRRNIQKGLNKGELMNALARAIFFGKHGVLREKELQSQLQRASALNIIINAVCVWNTVYLSKAVEELRETGDLDETLLQHTSPLGWEHINFLGEYFFDETKITDIHNLNPLNKE